MDVVEAEGGTLPLETLAVALNVSRPRDLTRRRNPKTGKGRDGVVTRLADVGVMEVTGDTVTLVAEWLDVLNEERNRAGEISLYRRDMARYNRERDGYRNRRRAKTSPHWTNVRGADGFIEDLERVEAEPVEPERAPEPELSPSPRPSATTSIATRRMLASLRAG